jgi:3-deoxy-D-manno-octulosonic-acid transferase
MLLYSLTLGLGLVVGAPWWVARMLTTSRYREGLWERLGLVPMRLFEDSDFPLKSVVWVHAVSVGELLAATRLVAELEAALGDGWVVAISTTTRTGQALARERFGAQRVFYYPLDFAWAVRAYLRVLRPAALVLMESELWPRMLHECRRAGVPVAVVNARVSDRSFARGIKLRGVWGRVLRGVSLWLAQSDEDARRLVAMGAAAESVQVSGNLKYDVRAPKESQLAALIREVAAGRPIVVAGSTVDRRNNNSLSEEEMVIQAWERSLRRELNVLLVLAPRHPERFGEVESVAMEFRLAKASAWDEKGKTQIPFGNDKQKRDKQEKVDVVDLVLLDTIGDLAAVYGIADVAFVGGSLVSRGGHNPLEPAQFGVPVVMGPHFENFRTVVHAMKSAGGIRIVADNEGLEAAFQELLTDRDAAQAMGGRGRKVFEEQQGATLRTTEALVALIGGNEAATQAETPC